MEETLTRDEKAQYQGATHDKNVAELLDMANKMNKRPESNEGSKDLPPGLNDGSQQAAATPVSLPTMWLKRCCSLIYLISLMR